MLCRGAVSDLKLTSARLFRLPCHIGHIRGTLLPKDIRVQQGAPPFAAVPILLRFVSNHADNKIFRRKYFSRLFPGSFSCLSSNHTAFCHGGGGNRDLCILKKFQPAPNFFVRKPLPSMMDRTSAARDPSNRKSWSDICPILS